MGWLGYIGPAFPYLIYSQFSSTPFPLSILQTPLNQWFSPCKVCKIFILNGLRVK